MGAPQCPRILIYIDVHSAVGDMVVLSPQIHTIRQHFLSAGQTPRLILYVKNAIPATTLFRPLVESGEMQILARRVPGRGGRLQVQATSWRAWLTLQATGYDIAVYLTRPRNMIDRLRARHSRSSYESFADFASQTGAAHDASDIVTLSHVASHHFPRPTIGLYVAASTPLRSWPSASWARLIAATRYRSANNYDIHLYGFGNVSRAIARGIAIHGERLGIREGRDYHDLIDQHSLEEDIAHCKGLELAITNDSGFLWVGNACGVKTLSILSGATFQRYSPYFRRNAGRWVAVESSLDCAPCSHSGRCPNMTRQDGLTFQNCMLEDRVDRVLDGMRRLLATPDSQPLTIQQQVHTADLKSLN